MLIATPVRFSTPESFHGYSLEKQPPAKPAASVGVRFSKLVRFPVVLVDGDANAVLVNDSHVEIKHGDAGDDQTNGEKAADGESKQKVGGLFHGTLAILAATLGVPADVPYPLIAALANDGQVPAVSENVKFIVGLLDTALATLVPPIKLETNVVPLGTAKNRSASPAFASFTQNQFMPAGIFMPTPVLPKPDVVVPVPVTDQEPDAITD